MHIHCKQAVHELAKIERKDVLFYSVANNTLAHLPYMIVVDHDTRCVHWHLCTRGSHCAQASYTWGTPPKTHNKIGKKLPLNIGAWSSLCAALYQQQTWSPTPLFTPSVWMMGGFPLNCSKGCSGHLLHTRACLQPPMRFWPTCSNKRWMHCVSVRLCIIRKMCYNAVECRCCQHSSTPATMVNTMVNTILVKQWVRQLQRRWRPTPRRAVEPPRGPLLLHRAPLPTTAVQVPFSLCAAASPARRHTLSACRAVGRGRGEGGPGWKGLQAGRDWPLPWRRRGHAAGNAATVRRRGLCAQQQCVLRLLVYVLARACV